MVRKTKEEALATRQRLLDTAEAIFLQRGVARTSLHDIASAAGLTRGAVYWHFADKATLYNALMDRLSSHLSEPVQAIVEMQGDDPVGALRRLVMLPIRLLQEDERVRRLFIIAMHRVEFSDDLATLWLRNVASGSAYIDLMATMFAAAAHPHGECELRLTPRAAALGLFALVDGLVTYATIDPAHLPGLAQAQDVIDAYLRGVGCLPAATVAAGPVPDAAT